MCDCNCGERARELMLDAAIAEGRIERGERDTWTRLFETDEAIARSFLADRQPDSARAMRNAASDWSEEDEQLYRAYAAATYGVPGAEVI